MSKNHYCLNVGRKNKKNNFFFKVNIEDFCYSQKCHDEVCSSYSSPEISLPPELFFATMQEKLNYSITD